MRTLRRRPEIRHAVRRTRRCRDEAWPSWCGQRADPAASAVRYHRSPLTARRAVPTRLPGCAQTRAVVAAIAARAVAATAGRGSLGRGLRAWPTSSSRTSRVGLCTGSRCSNGHERFNAALRNASTCPAGTSAESWAARRRTSPGLVTATSQPGETPRVRQCSVARSGPTSNSSGRSETAAAVAHACSTASDQSTSSNTRSADGTPS